MTRIALRNVSTNTIGYLVEYGIVGLTSILAAIASARVLEPWEFGVLSLFLSLTTGLQTALQFGLPQLLFPRFSRRRAGADQTLALALKVVSVVVLGVIVMGTAICWSVRPALWLIFSLIALRLLLAPAAIFSAAMQGSERPWLYIAPRTLSATIAIVGLLLGWASGGSLIVFAAILGGEAVVFFLLLLMQYRAPRSRITLWRTKIMMRTVLPLAGQSAFTAIYYRADQVLLGAVGTLGVLGLYAGAVRVAEIGNMFVVAVLSAVGPYVIRGAVGGGRTDIYRFVWLGAAISGPAFAILSLAAGERFLAWMLGAAYAEGATALAIYSLSISFVALCWMLSRVATALGEARIVLVASAVGAMAILGLGFVLISLSGMAGAAWATVLSYGCVLAVLLCGARRSRTAVLRMLGSGAGCSR